VRGHPVGHLRAVHRGQCHRVVDQRHRAGGQHRHAGQTGQARELRPQVLDHHFLVAQHFVHVHGHALRGRAEDDHRQRAPLQLLRLRRGLQQGTGPVERHRLAGDHDVPLRIGLGQFVAVHAAHHLHQVGRHAHREGAGAHHHHLRDRGGQRQHQAEVSTLAGPGLGLDAAAQREHVVADHVHAHASAGQRRHFVRGGQAGQEHQLRGFVVTKRLTGLDQPQGLRLFAQALQVQPGAVVLEAHRHVVELLAQPDVDAAFGRLALGQAHIGRLNAVHHAVAQQVFKGGGHAVEHPAVHFDLATGDVQPHLLAGFLGRLAHHAVQALGNALELHHARAQQVALQLAGLTGLGGQAVFGRFHRALQVALHGGHVVDRLGHHAGELLHAGEAVELQRVEGLVGVARLGQPRLHLRLGLQFQVAQLLAQAVQVAGEFAQRATQGDQFGLHARAGDHHLAGLVDQAVEQFGTHPHGGTRAGGCGHRRLRQAQAAQASRGRWHGCHGGRLGCRHLAHHRRRCGCVGCRHRRLG